MSDVVELSCELIRRHSVTPDDAGCQQVLATRLSQWGFHCEHLRFGETDNLWATHGSGSPVLVLGFGRVGQALAVRLAALGARVGWRRGAGGG